MGNRSWTQMAFFVLPLIFHPDYQPSFELSLDSKEILEGKTFWKQAKRQDKPSYLSNNSPSSVRCNLSRWWSRKLLETGNLLRFSEKERHLPGISHHWDLIASTDVM